MSKQFIVGRIAQLAKANPDTLIDQAEIETRLAALKNPDA